MAFAAGLLTTARGDAENDTVDAGDVAEAAPILHAFATPLLPPLAVLPAKQAKWMVPCRNTRLYTAGEGRCGLKLPVAEMGE